MKQCEDLQKGTKKTIMQISSGKITEKTNTTPSILTTLLTFANFSNFTLGGTKND